MAIDEHSEAEDRRIGLLGAVVLMLVVLAVWTAALTIFFQIRQREELSRVVDKNSIAFDKQAANLASLAEGYDAIRDQLLATGETPVAPPTVEEATGGDVPATVKGERGDPGPAPTDEQVRLAVVTYLEAHPPESGRPPTQEEIAAATAAFCEAHGGCLGPRGPPGSTGDPGEPGTPGETGATGAPGSTPTDEQIAAAVATFCSQNNGCVGIPGPAVESFSFTFAAFTYVCTDPDGDLNYTCEQQASP